MALVPYDDRDGVIWFDGETVDWREAKIHVLTHGLHYGSCVFEGERAYDGVIFKSREHSQRLLQSANLLGFEIPYELEEIEAAKADTFARSGLQSAYVRCFAWRGAKEMGVSTQNNTTHLAMAIWAWGDYFADKMAGIRLTIADWKRPSPESAPCKSKAAGLYMICTLSKHAAEAEGYADALMYDYKGRVAECTGAHIFFVRGEEVHTPTTECILEGITRRTVLDLAQARGFKIIERDIYPSELPFFEECFITGTAAEVTPVREIKGLSYTPGAVTEALVTDYDALVRGKLDR
ncbi:MAG: branched-chain amino acid aminotransferase [Maricaulaceae bacterium]